MHDAWLQTFFRFSLTATLFTFRRDTTYRLILIIAPRRRDASNRLPTLSRRIQLQLIENRSTNDHCISLFLLFHPSILAFFSQTRSIPFYIFNRPSPFLDHLSRFHSRVLFLANYLMLHPHYVRERFVKWMIWRYFYK